MFIFERAIAATILVPFCAKSCSKMDGKYKNYSEATKKKLVDLIIKYQAVWDEENKELQKKPAGYKYNKTLKAWKHTKPTLQWSAITRAIHEMWPSTKSNASGKLNSAIIFLTCLSSI